MMSLLLPIFWKTKQMDREGTRESERERDLDRQTDRQTEDRQTRIT